MTAKFIGRKEELQTLNRLLQRGSASLIVIRGRRRIGKSRLIKEFAKNHLFYNFAGLPPTSATTAPSQRAEFARQLEEKFDFKGLKFKTDDWGDLFTILANHTPKGRVIILLDEISWMGSKDPDFLGKLKNVWDMQLSNNPELMLILCGSVSSWIEKNIIHSTGFVGRLTSSLVLEELPLYDCNHFWDKYGQGVSAYEKFKVLSMTGGIPRYLELIHPKYSAEENIKQLCFLNSGSLVAEFEHIFTDIFSKRNTLYKKILEALANGALSQEILTQKLNLPRTGELSEYLNNLVLSGFVSRDFTWLLKTGKISKLSRYRLKDNYVRFYLKYIWPNQAKIGKNNFYLKSLTALPGWDAIMGLQFENLVLNNHQAIIQLLGINPQDLVFDNPFFQRKTIRTPGCQIDYLIQTRFNTVYVCEIKFSRFEITPDVIEEVKEKLKKLQLPRHFSYRPVLIHVNGVREDVIDSGFFSEMIDFSQFLWRN